MGRRTLVLIVALLLAAVATFAVWNFLSGVEDEAAAGREYQVVFRATETLAEGTSGSAVLDQLRYEEGDEETRNVPLNAVQSLPELEATLEGRVAAGPISAGQILTTDQWVEVTAEIRPLAERIPEGKQAITISADQTRGVNGFIEPGDRVNVIVTIDVEIDVPAEEEIILGEVQEEPPPGEEQTAERTVTKTFTRFVLQGLPVLAVGRDIRPEEDEPTEVVVAPVAEGEEAPEVQTGQLTLEVTADQAERLVYAHEKGSVWLTLVPEDFVEVPTEGVTIENLFGGDLGILTKLFPFLEPLEELLSR
jgi:pilus assembly protein CpaB